MQVDLKSLVQRLNPTCNRALEGAAGLCLSRTNYNIEIEHWLTKLLEAEHADLPVILAHFEIDAARFTSDLNASLDRLKTGNGRQPTLSPDVVDLLQNGWLVASMEFDAAQTRSGHLLCALLSDATLARAAFDISPELRKIDKDELVKEFVEITQESSEAKAQPLGSADAEPGSETLSGKTPALDQFTIDLTAAANSGKLDPVLGRDHEIRQIIDILTRRRQNNPILTGEAGVGKTAVVEGFALRIAAGDVPDPLKPVAVRTLDLGLLQAGAGVKGEFENRLKSVIEEVKSSPTPVILFIDEAHTLVGAGGQKGQGDAANLLKPALARGELRTIAATTWAEYKEYFEDDAALARRFQVVKVEEPGDEAAISMMRGVADSLERHHGVRILDEAIDSSVKLSKRYISGRQLPDKSVSLLDTACARVAIGQAATPPAVEDCRRDIDRIETTLRILNREEATGHDHAERIAELTEEKQVAEESLKSLENQWREELRLVREIRDIRSRLESGIAEFADESSAEEAESSDDAESETAELPPPTEEERAELRKQQQQLTDELEKLQGETPLLQVCVDAQTVSEVVAGWTGIPVGRMVSDEISTILTLQERMEKSVVGQSHALEKIAQCVQTSRAVLDDPAKPIGVFLLAGPSGVGKTETAITLANLLYGGEQNMSVLNMSEFKGEHQVSTLVGAAPGLVGYGKDGVLTGAVLRKPYSVVLLDEMEKADPGLQDVFYQVFDKGMLRDGKGRDVDFKNTLIIMTSNAGSELIMNLCSDPETRPDPDGLRQALHEELLKTFKPAFLGRLNVVPYYPLSDEIMANIVNLKLGKIGRRVQENHKADFTWDPSLVDTIVGRCTEVETGARNIDHILSGTLLPELAAEMLSRLSKNEGLAAVNVSVTDDGEFNYDIQ